MKKLLATIISISLVFSLMSFGVNAEEQRVYTTSCDLAEYIYTGYYHCDTSINLDTEGPIHIVNATLTKDNVDTEVYLIGLSGTEFIFNQTTGIITDLQVGFEQDNLYLQNVVNTITEVVPENSNIILTGHSLGGMIAQQASGNYTLKSKYNILNVISFGSPLINPIGREGTVKRLGDTSDIVPYLSVHSALLPFWQVLGLEKEDGGYGGFLDFDAHMYSYLREDVWGEYDVLGFKGGNATLRFNEEDVQGFGSSIIPWLEGLPTIDLSFWS